MFNEILEKAGLNDNERSIYINILHSGELTAAQVAKDSPTTRTNTYNVLESLAQKGLIVIRERNGFKSYRITHPDKLLALVEARRASAQSDEEIIKNALPNLITAYNTSHNRPNVHYFEGKDGVEKVTFDTLEDDGESLTITDIEAVITYIPGINSRYVKKRDKMNKKKRVLLIDNPFARDYMKDYYRSVTNTHFIKVEDAKPISSVLQIYNNKISYITLSEERMIGVIIEDPRIYDTNKYLFDYMWEKSMPLESILGDSVTLPENLDL